MPMASGRPPSIPPEPKPTPTARPSGKLWIVIAMMNSQTRRKDAASGPSRPVLKCSCGSLSFINATAPMPKRIETQTMAAGIAPFSNIGSAASNAGMIREKNEAESMTPAAKPSDRSRVARDGMRPNSTGIAPTAVSDPAARLPRKPSIIGDRFSISGPDYPSA